MPLCSKYTTLELYIATVVGLLCAIWVRYIPRSHHSAMALCMLMVTLEKWGYHSLCNFGDSVVASRVLFTSFERRRRWFVFLVRIVAKNNV